jgi:hypothetical protein
VLHPNYSYGGIAWSGERLVVSRSGSEPGDEFRLVLLDARGAVVSERVPEAVDGCLRLDEMAPTNVGGGLAWVSNCLTPEPEVRNLLVLAADDLSSPVRVRSSVESRTSIRTLDINDERILTSFGNRICETIGRMGEAAIEAVSITVTGPGGSFDTEFDPGGDDCRTTGIAELPATSPDGRLAFFASTLAIGRDGLTRLEAPSDLYVASKAGDDVIRLGVELFDPTALRWTPDGSWLIASGRTESGGTTLGVDPATGVSTPLIDFRIGALAWSSDDLRVATIRPASGLSGTPDEVILIEAAVFEKTASSSR